VKKSSQICVSSRPFFNYVNLLSGVTETKFVVLLTPDLLQRLAEKSITKKELLIAVEKDFTLVSLLIAGVASPKATVRYSCASTLVNLTEKNPKELYPHMDFFISLLDSKYRILKWNGMAAIANLCAVDVDKKFDANFDKYYGFLNDEYMVTVANVVGNSSKIALAKPYLVPRITDELLRVEKISISPHLTDECRRVIAEQAIKSFNQFFGKMGAAEKAKVLSFVKKYADSTRASLRKEADLFLRRRGM